MFDERIMLFKLDGLWQVLRLKYFSDNYESMEEDIEGIHDIKDTDYNPNDYMDILKGIDYVPQRSLKGMSWDEIEGKI